MFIMWLLVLIFTVKVGGVPFDRTENASAATGSATSIGRLFSIPVMNDGEILEELEGDFFIQEGDILMQEDRNAVVALWADVHIPYVISGNLEDREVNIITAFKMISENTCIRFHRRTTELNYLKFLNGKGCASYVGCRGGAQPVYYSHSCSVGNLCHEIIHALGMHHEHTRMDRDEHIIVQWQSIKAGKEKNFMMKQGNTLNLPYDLSSIMHYGKYFFTADLNPTILPKRDEVHIGQRKHLSKLDIEKMNKLYHCDERVNL